MNTPYLLFGSPPIGDLAAKHLLASHYPPAAVITDTKLTTEQMIDLVHEHNAGFILVVGYGRILKQALLDSVAGQVLNIHPSLLPEYRGPAPVVQALLDGVTETGVALMEIDDKMDHGPLLATESINLTGKETPTELYSTLIYKGTRLFLENIEAYLGEDLDMLPQNHDDATYTHYITKEQGLIDPSKPADELERQIRAFQGWPTSWLMVDGKRLIVHAAHVSHKKFILDEVQPEGGKRMPLSAYLQGKRLSEHDFYAKVGLADA